jgi:hypothetical protein
LLRVGALLQIKPGVPSAGLIHCTPKNISEGDAADFEPRLSQFGCPTRKMLLQIEHEFRRIGEVKYRVAFGRIEGVRITYLVDKFFERVIERVHRLTLRWI